MTGDITITTVNKSPSPSNINRREYYCVSVYFGMRGGAILTMEVVEECCGVSGRVMFPPNSTWRWGMPKVIENKYDTKNIFHSQGKHSHVQNHH